MPDTVQFINEVKHWSRVQMIWDVDNDSVTEILKAKDEPGPEKSKGYEKREQKQEQNQEMDIKDEKRQYSEEIQRGKPKEGQKEKQFDDQPEQQRKVVEENEKETPADEEQVEKQLFQTVGEEEKENKVVKESSGTEEEKKIMDCERNEDSAQGLDNDNHSTNLNSQETPESENVLSVQIKITQAKEIQNVSDLFLNPFVVLCRCRKCDPEAAWDDVERRLVHETKK